MNHGSCRRIRKSRCNKGDNKMSCLLTDESLLATSSIEKDHVEHTKRRKSGRAIAFWRLVEWTWNLVYCCFPITIRSWQAYWVQPNAGEGSASFENSAKRTKTRTPCSFSVCALSALSFLGASGHKVATVGFRFPTHCERGRGQFCFYQQNLKIYYSHLKVRLHYGIIRNQYIPDLPTTKRSMSDSIALHAGREPCSILDYYAGAS